MQVGLGLELPTAPRLLLEMDLVGEQFKSALPRAEGLLRGGEYDRAIRAVSGNYARRAKAGRGYASVIDFLIALASPGWDEVIQDYYEGQGRPLIGYVDAGTIAAMDLAVVQLLEELRGLQETHGEAGWAEGASATEHEELIEVGIRLFITPHFPAAVPDSGCPPSAAANENNPMLAPQVARGVQESP